MVVGANSTTAADAFTTAFRRQLDMSQLFAQGDISVYRLTARLARSTTTSAAGSNLLFSASIVIQMGAILALLLGLFGRRSWLRARPFTTRGARTALRPDTSVSVPVGSQR